MKHTLIAVAFSALALPVFAQVGTSTPLAPGQFREQERERIQQVRQGFQQEVKDLREAFSDKVKNIREAGKKEIENEKNKLKEGVKVLRDTKKRTRVVQLGDQIAKLNADKVEQFGEQVQKLESTLTRIQTRMQKAASQGLNTQPVQTAIAAAQTAISSAKTAITAQAAKLYAIPVTATTTDSNVGKVGAQVRDALRADLLAVQTLVKSARDAVQQAAVTLAQIHGVSLPPAPTPTSTATSTGTSTNP